MRVPPRSTLTDPLLPYPSLFRAPPAPARLPDPFEPTVAFEDVSFAYPGGRRAAHSALSFRVAAGERVAVVGASGAGKSSILLLLLRPYDPPGGTVPLAGPDLPPLAAAATRRPHPGGSPAHAL